LPWKTISKQDSFTQLVLAMMKIFDFVLSSKEHEISINFLNAAGIIRNEDLRNYLMTIEYLNLLRFRSDSDIILFFSENFTTDEAFDERCERFSFFNFSFEEFFDFFKQEIFEYILINGEIFPESEKTEIGLCVFFTAQKLFSKLQHLSLDNQRRILTNVFNFMRDHRKKISFKELLDVLS
jgi:hypothetical protein